MNTTNLNNLSQGEAAFLGGMVGSMAVFGVAFYVLLVIALWKIFTKAGVKGWKSLIPIYNMVCAYRIVGISPWWVLWSFLANFAFAFTVGLVAGDRQIDWNKDLPEDIVKNGWVILTALVMTVVSLYLNIRFAIRLARAFKKGGWFAVGIFIFPSIFTLILGFGSAKYDKKVALK